MQPFQHLMDAADYNATGIDNRELRDRFGYLQAQRELAQERMDRYGRQQTNEQTGDDSGAS